MSERVLVLTPTGKDGQLVTDLLSRADIQCEMASDLSALCSLLAEPAAAVLVAEEALGFTTLDRLVSLLSQQPSWSDLPLVIMTSGSKTGGRRWLDLFSPHADVTLVERPIHGLTLVSILKGAIRSRHRQYQVRDLLEQQVLAMQQRDAFISIASHELKTPLTALRLQIQAYQLALQRRNSPTAPAEDVGRLLATADRQIDRLVQLVEDMLDVSRVDTGRLALRPERVELRGLLDELVDRFGPQLAAAGCTVSVVSTESIVGFWDRTRIEQVIVNLFTNALKYAAGAPIEIRLIREDERVRIRVQDHGRGIALSDQTRVFDRFAQLDTGVGGLGIGLYVSREVARAHRGDLTLDSEPGQGAAFTLTLPLRPPEAGPVAGETLDLTRSRT